MLAEKDEASSFMSLARKHLLYFFLLNISDIMSKKIIFPVFLKDLFDREKAFILLFFYYICVVVNNNTKRLGLISLTSFIIYIQ